MRNRACQTVPSIDSLPKRLELWHTARRTQQRMSLSEFDYMGQCRTAPAILALYRKPLQIRSAVWPVIIGRLCHAPYSIALCHGAVFWQEGSMKRVAIYLRVSTSKQDTDNQRREL